MEVLMGGLLTGPYSLNDVFADGPLRPERCAGVGIGGGGGEVRGADVGEGV